MTDIVQRDERWVVTEANLCRLCLSVSDSIILIFGGKGLSHQLLEKIQKYLPIKISKSDSFPHQICHHCTSTLLAFDTLYHTCLSSNQKLQSLSKGRNPLKSETITEVDDVLRPLKKGKTVNDNEDVTTNVVGLNSDSHIKSGKLKKNNGIIKRSKKSDKGKNKSLLENNIATGEDHPETINLDALSSMIKDDSDTNFPNNIFSEVTINDKNGKEGTIDYYEKALFKTEFLKKQEEKIPKQQDKSETLRCKICNIVYKTEANLERHNTREHLTGQVECPVCHSSFNSKKLNGHLKSVHGVKSEAATCDNEFKCHLCDKLFKNKYVRNAHEKEVHLSEPIQCKLCDFKGTRTVLQRHKRYVHAEKRFFCSICPGAFKTLHTLKLHMTSHSDVRCYTCDICGMGFKRLNNVRDHMKCHEQKSNQCQICGNFFARKRYLAIHEKTIHNFYADGVVPEEKGFECEICGAKLKWKKNLLAHMRIHTGEKPYVCKICNKNFNCHGALKTHMAKHNVFNENDQLPSSQVLLGTDVNAFNTFNSQSV